MRVLVIAPSWVGDAILSEPLVARLSSAGSGTPIDVVAPPWCAPVYARMRGIGRIIEAPAAHGSLALAARRRAGHALRGEHYTHAYVLPNTWKSALLPWFARISHRIGYIGEARHGLLTDARRLDRRAMPRLVTRYAALAAPRAAPSTASASPTAAASPTDAAAPSDGASPVLVPDRANLDAAVDALGLSRARRVAILCPGAEFGPAKRWPVEHFAALAALLAHDGYAVWAIGSPNDKPITAALAATREAREAGLVDLAGRTDLGTAIDLLSMAALVVSNDSGLMHAAAATGVPLVALFGSSSPVYTPPLSPRARVAKIEIECSPCFKRECPLGHFRCMRDLSPRIVYNLARELTAGDAAARQA
ncbi:MAG TPA: lipopolysaccharide heptosyltransferase II [Casimicrobiaceae bacterium]